MEPVIILAFANDRDDYLPMINRERKTIFKALQKHDDQNLIKVIREENISVDDIFDHFIHYHNNIAIFHYGGHAGGTHLQLETMAGDAQHADAHGLAQLMGQQESLKLVFLNGCATLDQVKLLHAAGVPAVIATSVPIQDKKAVDFSVHFYKKLSRQESIEEAFKTACAYVHTKYGHAGEIGIHRGISWQGKDRTGGDEFPWGLYIHPEKQDALEWTLPRQKPTEPINKLLSKLCDRVEQLGQFKTFFHDERKKNKKRPQFFIIHGHQLSCHQSFLDRLIYKVLKEIAEREYGESEGTVYPLKVEWAEKGNLADQQNQLKINIQDGFNDSGYFTVTGAADLYHHPILEKRSIATIKHDIYSENWNNHTAQLIEWYMKNYWAELPPPDAPHFLIFFNVMYQQLPQDKGFLGLKALFSREKSYSREHIVPELKSICESHGEDKSVSCLLLDELSEVKVTDVLKWCDKHKFYLDVLERKEKTESIFKDEKGRIIPKAMALVEPELRKIVKAHEREVL